MSPDNPSFRDLYEVQERVDAKLEKQSNRLRRIEIGCVPLTVAIASPKVGGPSADQIVSSVLRFLAA